MVSKANGRQTSCTAYDRHIQISLDAICADDSWCVGRHLDADEAVVLGAALYAANLSTTFRLRKFGMSDGVTYPVAFQVLWC